MGSSFFIDKKLNKKIEKDIKKRNDIENKIKKLQEELEQTNLEIENDLDEFYIRTDSHTILSTLKFYEEHSSGNKKDIVNQLEIRYKDKKLYIEDTLNLMDWYEKMCDDFNNKI